MTTKRRKSKLTLPKNPRYRKAVKTYLANNGRAKYAESGSEGGKLSPTKFSAEDSERASLMAKRSWDIRRARAKEQYEQESREQQGQ
jgi:general stress protein YciG